MTTPHHILTLALARTSAFALVYAWMCLSACIGMSASAWAISHAHADTDRQSQAQSHPPAANAVVAIVTINASAIAGLSLSITRVDFYDGATLIGYTVAQRYNWTYTWTNAPQGNHAITVKAYDSLGNIAKSSVVNLTINGGANAPAITITAPANGAVGTAVPITANVSLASGALLSKIEYFEGTHSIGISSSASYAWTPLVPGIYTVTAKVTDSKGATGVSAPVIITVTDASGETITFLHNDFAGSAIAATDAAGALLWKENYTPFGDRAVKAVNATGNRQWYTGKPVDSETGLSNFGARMYDPVIGRFMGVDAVGFSEGNLHSFNRYAYGNNNPYKFVDPDGNAAVDWVRGGLTAFSFCPSICGSAFSAIDGAVYAAQGDSTGAAISFGAAAIGIVSDAGVAKVAAMAAKEGAAALKGGSEASIVYRGLAKGEDAAAGLSARAPSANNSEISHVAGKVESQWISTTKSLSTATEKYGENGVVKIDLNRVGSQVSDVSKGFPNGGQISNWAKKDQEVLIRGSIPAEAITRIK